MTRLFLVAKLIRVISCAFVANISFSHFFIDFLNIQKRICHFIQEKKKEIPKNESNERTEFQRGEEKTLEILNL